MAKKDPAAERLEAAARKELRAAERSASAIKENSRGGKTERYIRLALIAVLAGVFVFSGFKLISILREHRRAEEVYQGLIDEFLKTDPEESGLPSGESEASREESAASGEESEESSGVGAVSFLYGAPVWPDTDALVKANGDYIGWLYSADTPINDPICIAADNDYYLYRNFRRQSEFAGCLFMDFRGSGDWTNRNNLVYGHTVAGSTTRFGTLRYYSSQVYYRNHPVMWLFTRDHVYKCYVFAVYKTRFTKDGVFKTFEGDPDGFTAWLKEAEAKSVIDSNISYRDVTKTLSLCTCCTGASQGYRWNVVLSLVQQDP